MAHLGATEPDGGAPVQVSDIEVIAEAEIRAKRRLQPGQDGSNFL